MKRDILSSGLTDFDKINRNVWEFKFKTGLKFAEIRIAVYYTACVLFLESVLNVHSIRRIGISCSMGARLNTRCVRTHA